MSSLSKLRQKRYLSPLKKISHEVNILEPVIQAKSKNAVKEEVQALRNLVKYSQNNKKNIKHFNGIENELLIKSLALLREISQRAIGQRPYDEQIWAGLALFNGFIVEMKNGEGKTLAATIPVFLEYLKGGNSHIITANSYLSERDAEWMGPIYHELGISVGVVKDNSACFSEPNSKKFVLKKEGTYNKKNAYECDVVYGAASSFIFDYMDDNRVYFTGDIKQINGLNFVIIDEVDHVLIDEAQQSFIKSEAIQSHKEKFLKSQEISDILTRDNDYTINEKNKEIEINEKGIKKIESHLNVSNIYEPKLMKEDFFRGILPAIDKALYAKEFSKEDIDYLASKRDIIIIDQLTGRPDFHRKYSGGLHQALEVKHGFEPSSESETINEVTLQKFVQKYNKIVGMTGTALFDEKEYKVVYNKKVIVIPSRFRPLRVDKSDAIYRTLKGRMDRVLQEVEAAHKKMQPVLIGTLSVEISEQIAARLRKMNIPCEVLSAKKHDQEAEIIKRAGEKGAVTISAKMAGRGTDIKLGEGVEELGGLFVIGVERNESRRMDDQLKGRAGRHGKPGSAQFFIALDDNLMRLFGSENIAGILDKIGVDDEEEIRHKMVDRSINRAQARVNLRNFEIRQHLLEYDEVLDRHRSYFFDLRSRILNNQDIYSDINTIVDNSINRILLRLSFNKLKYLNQSQISNIIKEFDLVNLLSPFENKNKVLKSEIVKWLKNLFISLYIKFETDLGKENFESVMKYALLYAFNNYWQEHLKSLDSLKNKMSTIRYAHNDILAWYMSQGDKIFDDLIVKIEEWVIGILIGKFYGSYLLYFLNFVIQNGTPYYKLRQDKQFIGYLNTVGEIERKTFLNLENINYQSISHDNQAQSLEDLLKIEEVSPDNVWNLFQIGMRYFLERDYKNSLKYHLKIEDIESANTLNLGRIAINYDQINDYEKAIEYYSKTEKLKPNEHWVLMGKATAYKMLKNYQNALDYFLKYYHTKPQDFNVLLDISECYLGLKNYKEAIEFLKSAELIAPLYSDLKLLIGYCYFKLKNNKRFFEYQKMAEITGRRDFEDLRDVSFFSTNFQNRFQLIKCFLEIEETVPDNVWNLFQIGICYFVQENFKESLKYHLKVEKHEPQNALNFGRIGLCYSRLKEYQEAINYFLKYHKELPDDNSVLGEIRNCYEELGQPEQSAKFLQKAKEDKWFFK